MEKIQNPTATLTLNRQSPISNLSKLFSYNTKFQLLDHLRFELWCKTCTHREGCTHTYTHTQTLARIL